MSGLSEEQKKIIDSLSPASAETQKLKYRWDENFQRRILALLMTDKHFLVQAKALIEPDYFTMESHVVIAKILYDYFAEYNGIPEKFIVEKLMLDKIKDRQESIITFYKVELENIYESFVPNSESRKILLDKVLVFARMQSLRIAADYFQKEMKKDPENEEMWTRVYEKFKGAMNVNKNFELGFDLFPNISQMFEELQKDVSPEERFTSGFPKIDNSIAAGGPKRGEIYAWIGLPGKGKSLCLTKGAVENVKMGKKAVYISLEMDWVSVAKRFISQFALVEHNALMDNKTIIQSTTDAILKEYDDKSRFIIKQFPSGQADIDDIKAYLTQLELSGFVPDLLIVDYPGEMKDKPGIPLHESKYLIMRDLRGMAREKNMCVFTAMQPNKEAKKLAENQLIDEGVIGTSYDQFKTLDGMWSINQKDNETEAGYGIFYVAKNRTGSSKFSFFVKYNKQTLDITECSAEEYRKAMHNLAASKADKVSVDGKVKKDSDFTEFDEESDYAS